MKPIKINSDLEKCLKNKERDNLKVSSLKDLGEIKIVRVLGKEDSYYSIWKEMPEKHHYLHSAKLFGQQIKYLIKSERNGGQYKEVLFFPKAMRICQRKKCANIHIFR